MNIPTDKLNGRIKVKLKEVKGRPFTFYKKGTPINEILELKDKRKTPTNDEKLHTVTLLFKEKNLSWFKKMITWFIVMFFGKRYDWDTLRAQMKDGGYDPEHKPIAIHPSTTDNKYKLVDGMHRLRILRELYGDEYEIEVRYGRRNPIKRLIEKITGIKVYINEQNTTEKPKPCTSCTIENVKKYLKKFFNKVQLVNTIKVITGLVFLVWINFKYLVLLLLSLIVYLLVVRMLRYFNYDPTKIILPIKNILMKQILMTLISNIPQLTIIIPVFVISVLMIINGPLEFLIFGTIIYLCERYTMNEQKEDD